MDELSQMQIQTFKWTPYRPHAYCDNGIIYIADIFPFYLIPYIAYHEQAEWKCGSHKKAVSIDKRKWGPLYLFLEWKYGSIVKQNPINKILLSKYLDKQ